MRVLAYRISLLVFIIGVSGVVSAEDNLSPKTMEAINTSFDLPRDQVQEYRALQAEIRAYQAEASIAIRERNDKINSLLSLWKERYKIDDMRLWSIDMNKSKLFLNEASTKKGK